MSIKRPGRRDFLRMSAVAPALLGACSSTSVNSVKRRPNVVLIMTDDQGYGDLGCHGNDLVRTPNLDRFAEQSTEFTRFYCSPVCAPTRSSLMTGRYNYRTGVLHTSRGAAMMSGEETTIAEALSNAGYRTGIFGKWHLGDNYPMRPIDQGFQESLIHKSGGIGQTPDKPNGYFDPKLWRNGKPEKHEGYCTDIFTDAAMRFIEDNREGPFFVYLPTNAPHDPLIVGEDYSGPYEKLGLSARMARLYGMVTNIDDNAGRLLEHLRKHRLEDDTIVIFLSDNGGTGLGDRYDCGLRASKGSAYEGGIRSPFYIRWPGRFAPKKQIDRITAHVDMFPTLLDVCGAGIPDGVRVDGRSLMPLLGGDGAEWEDRTLFFQFHRGMQPRLYQNCAAVSQRYKAVANPGLTEEVDSAPEPRFELYDIEADPGEERNLADELPEIAARLRQEYERWFEDVRSSRGFAPGVIHIGSEKENPAHLCRYQDSGYVGGVPRGWPVEIERSGQYEVSINRGEHQGKGKIFLRFNDHVDAQPVAAGENRAVFPLGAGTGHLEIWDQEDGEDRIVHTNNDTAGDVEIRLVDGGT